MPGCQTTAILEISTQTSCWYGAFSKLSNATPPSLAQPGLYWLRAILKYEVYLERFILQSGGRAGVVHSG